MKQPKKKDIGSLLFSAFLVTAFLVCAYFLIGLINNSFTENESMRQLLTAGLFTLFGLLLFYATRVGDGKQVWRFSLVTLIVMVLPALYIVLTSVIPALPLHTQITGRSELLYLAGAALGYGIPYTFLSGYELDTSNLPSADVTEPITDEPVTEPEPETEETLPEPELETEETISAPESETEQTAPAHSPVDDAANETASGQEAEEPSSAE